MASKEYLEKEEERVKDILKRDLTPEQRESYERELATIQYSAGKTREAEKTEFRRKRTSGKGLTEREKKYEKSAGKLDRELEKARSEGYDVTPEQKETLYGHLRKYPSAHVKVSKTDKGMSVRIGKKVPTIYVVREKEGVRKATPEEIEAHFKRREEARKKALEEARERKKKGKKLREYIKEKVEEDEEFEPREIVKTDTFTEDLKEKIERDQERIEALSYTPVRETISYEQPERILIDTIDVEEGKQKQVIDTTFKWRSKFDVASDKLVKNLEKEPLATRVAVEGGLMLAETSPVVTIPKAVFPSTPMIKWSLQERAVAGLQTALWTMPFWNIPSKVLHGLSVGVGGFGLVTSVPSAMKGEPRAIAKSIISAGVLGLGVYGLYKDFNVMEKKVILKSERDSGFLRHDRKMLEISRIRLKGELLVRKKLDSIFGKQWRKLADIEGGGRIIARSVEGEFRAYGDYTYWSDKLAGRTYDTLFGRLTEDQIRAFDKGEAIFFKGSERGVSDVLFKGDVTRTDFFRSFDNEMVRLWKLKLKDLELSRAISGSEKWLDLRLIKPIDFDKSLFIQRMKFDLTYDKISLVGLGKGKVLSTEPVSKAVSDVLKFHPIELERAGTDLTTGLGGLETATSTLEKTMTKEAEVSVLQALEKKVEPKVITPIVLTPAEARAEVKEKEIISRRIDVDSIKIEEEVSRESRSYDTWIDERTRIKEKEEEIIGRDWRVPSEDLAQESRRSEREMEKTIPLLDYEIPFKEITTHIEKSIQKLELDTPEVTETLETPITRIDIPHIPREVIIETITDIPDLIRETRREFTLDFPETRARARVPEPSEKIYTPSYMAFELDLEAEMDIEDLEKELTSGLELRPIPKKKRRKKK